MKPHRFLAVVVSSLLLWAMGCQSIASKPEVNVSVENKSSRDIENVRARFGEYACSWGNVGRTFKAIYGLYPHPITAETELHWEVDGQSKIQKLDLREVYPPGKSGRLSFTVYDDSAEVSFRDLPQAK